ncbi:MAG: hypothetical protein AAGA80_26340 [Cyanobacteria bacterium P01_F01_bin.143]
MTSSPQNNQEINPLGKLVSLVALLAAALYFTGGIYRWAYFGFFQVEAMSLNLPVESFYFAAFQSLVGNPLRNPPILLRTTITFIITALLIIVTLQIFQKLQRLIGRYLGRIQLNLTSTQQISLNFLLSLINELVIVL